MYLTKDRNTHQACINSMIEALQSQQSRVSSIDVDRLAEQQQQWSPRGTHG